ncbi:MAG: hypothetical protein AAF292_11490 [Pseudomonadota bacterium]
MTAKLFPGVAIAASTMSLSLAGCSAGLADGNLPNNVIIQHIATSTCITHEGLESGESISTRPCIAANFITCDPGTPGIPGVTPGRDESCEQRSVGIDETLTWTDLNPNFSDGHQYEKESEFCLGGSEGGDRSVMLPALARACNDTPLTRWSTLDLSAGVGITRLRNRETGKCLTMTRPNEVSFRTVETAPCDEGDERQMWRIVKRSRAAEILRPTVEAP